MSSHSAHPSSVAGVVIHRLTVASDPRGNLAVGNFPAEVPFVPQRFFLVYKVPAQEPRGIHAHKECSQFLVCVSGSVVVVVDDGTSREEILLDVPNKGVFVPPMIWGTQHTYSPDAVLLVFASHPYDANDYIRDYDEYRRLKQA